MTKVAMPSTCYIRSARGRPRQIVATAVGVAFASAATGEMAAPVAPEASSDVGGANDYPAIADGSKQLDTVEVRGTYLKQATSPKFTAPLLDTPRSITVIPQQTIEDMGATDLVQALRIVPGITFGAGEGGNPQGDRPFLRGYDAQNSLFVDGVRDVGAQTRETFDIERIEVVKGPDSVFTGRSNGGGSINLATKMPLSQDFTRIDAGLGTADYQRVTLDGNYQFGTDSAFRINMLGYDAGVAGRDKVNSERFGFAPSITFGLDSPTTATLSYYHLKTDDLPDAGIPYLYSFNGLPAGVRVVHPTDGGDSNNFYGLVDRDFRDTQTDIVTLQLQHSFSDTLMLRNTTRYGRSRQDYILSQPDDSQGNVVNGEVWRRVLTRAGNTVTAINQTDLSGQLQLGSLRNDFDLGLELADENTTRDSYIVPYINGPTACGLGVGSASYYNCTSLSDPTPDDPWVPGTYDPATGTFTPTPITRANNPIDTTSTTQAIYALDTIYLSDQWLFNVGLRYDRFSTKLPLTYCPEVPGGVCPRGYQGVRITEPYRSDANFWSGQAGLVWKPVEQGSVYLSWSTSATPPGSFLGEGSEQNPVSLQDLDPEKSRNIEFGAKWEFMDGRLALTGDIFENGKTNAREQLPDGSYANIGETRVRGVELSATGHLTATWNITAGYAYLDSKLINGGFVGDEPNPINGTPLANTPKNSFSLWTDWQVAPTWSLGGGAFYVSEVAGSYRVNGADGQLTEFGVPSYWRFDAFASWQVNDHLGFRLNLQNLTDKVYYTKAYPVHFVQQGLGRSAILTTQLRF